MKAKITFNKKNYKINLSKPIDISIPIRGSSNNVNAWYVPHPRIEPVKQGDFIGSVSEGASTNFNNIYFNPHAHGTHTECVGHITKEFYSINQNLKKFFFLAELVTIKPEKDGNDLVITKKQLEKAIQNKNVQALVIRTLPNNNQKKTKQYSHTNPVYIKDDAIIFLRGTSVEHLLADLPSVDKEKDDGKLLSHKAFWNFEGKLRLNATITELIYVPDEIKDGKYFLNLQVAPFENDASPCRPILYKVLNKYKD